MTKWYERESLTKQQILAELSRTNDGGKPTLGFCHNSRRWTLFFMFGQPKTCTYPQAFKGCGGCSYYEKRMPNNYVIQKLQELRWGTKDE